jgi:hypothetical protein
MSETMQEMMEREMAEAIATLNKANRALDRLFNTQEREGKCRICEGNIAFCADCQEGEGNE